MAYFKTNVLDNQIKALPTIATASGSIATFTTDKAENLVDCEVQIVATGGGGTPTTPIAINGFSQANILVASKNLFNKATIVNNKWFSDNGSEISISGKFYSALIPVKPNTDYYLTNVVGAGSFISTVHFESDRTTIIGAKNILGSNTQSGYITTFSNSAFMLINGFLSDIDTVQVVKGNTATAYEQPTTYNIPFGQTIYGGVLNVGTGVLRVTHWYLNIVGTENLYLDTAPNVISLANIPVPISQTNIDLLEPKSNYAKYSTQGTGNFDNNEYGLRTSGIIYYKNTSCSTVQNFKDYFALNNLQVSYKLATPQTIQLDSTTIQTIANSENNIWSDTGDIEVKFVLSVGSYVNQNV